jgi:hypothetical protein
LSFLSLWLCNLLYQMSLGSLLVLTSWSTASNSYSAGRSTTITPSLS